ncbi:MAG: hypothetical protein EON58_00395 [Alphaproteobacteria bacterium]|nr:MAG: hypothetical protein EON58_00395 [Alphaproteobacteria bacterium]
MADNIIDSRERFKERSQANSSGREDKLESVILAGSRLSNSDKSKFAENLGKLAARVDPANPRLGAQKMVSISGLEGVWEKRKRFFRLPGEDAPNPTKDGEYGSRPRTFVRLAQAAGTVLAGSTREELLIAERRRAVRALADGSSFLPTFAPSDPGDRTAKSLLDHFSSSLCTAIAERTRITDLWATLKDSPFGVDAFDADELSLVEPSPYGDAATVPASLLRPLYREHIIAGRFNAIGGTLGVDTEWAKPAIVIGLIAFPVETRIFVVPEEIAVEFGSEKETEEGLISATAQHWLQGIGYDHGGLPELTFAEDRRYGWKPCGVSVMRWVGLEIDADDNGDPCLNIVTWGSHDRIGFSFWEVGLAVPEQGISQSNGKLSQARYVDLDGSHLAFAIHDIPFDSSQSGHPPVVGLLPWDFEFGLHSDEFELKGWTEEQETFAILASDKGRFYPTMPEAEPINGPLMGGSVGASILQNVRFSSKENSMAALLIEKARVTADAGLKFRESLIETYREAFRHI